MFSQHTWTTLLAQAGAATDVAADAVATNAISPWIIFLIVAALFVLPFIAGGAIARNLKMADHGWKIGIILWAIASSAVICYFGEIRWAVDLKGGAIMIYEVSLKQTEEQRASEVKSESESEFDFDAQDMAALVAAIQKRINPGGVSEIIVRPFGAKQIQIIIPDATQEDIEFYRKDLIQAGILKFRIVADRNVHHSQIRLAELTDNEGLRTIRDEEGEIVAEWVELDKEKFPQPPSRSMTRGGGDRLEEILVIFDPETNVRGDDLSSVSKSIGPGGGPIVSFMLHSSGASRMGKLTGRSLVENGPKQLLGIVMDGRLISAPRIQDVIRSRGQITGQFTNEEVDSLVRVLRAGKLPATLGDEPISVNMVNPLLGKDLIAKGATAILFSLAAVLVFMSFYYRFSGIIACFALMLNLLFILAMMIVVRGAFSLPGLAGLVLTVGMSVDANVLIFERIREELNRGSALRMAIRNGFDKAISTIVDANLTTLIVAIVLYQFSSDSIKGFAVTLILGILMSMFTAIFCSRVVFEIAERKRRNMKTLKMRHIVGQTNVNFIGKRGAAAVLSIVLIAVSIVSVVGRGRDILANDLAGGTSVQVVFAESWPIEIVRKLVNTMKEAEPADFVKVNAADLTDQAPETAYSIERRLMEAQKIAEELTQILREDGDNRFRRESEEDEESGKKRDLFTIKPTGDSTVQLVLQEPVSLDEITALAHQLFETVDDVSVSEIVLVEDTNNNSTDEETTDENIANNAPGSIYKIDTDLKSVEDLQNRLIDIFENENKMMFVRHHTTVTTPEILGSTEPPASENTDPTETVPDNAFDDEETTDTPPDEENPGDASSTDESSEELTPDEEGSDDATTEESSEETPSVEEDEEAIDPTDESPAESTEDAESGTTASPSDSQVQDLRWRLPAVSALTSLLIQDSDASENGEGASSDTGEVEETSDTIQPTEETEETSAEPAGEPGESDADDAEPGTPETTSPESLILPDPLVPSADLFPPTETTTAGPVRTQVTFRFDEPINGHTLTGKIDSIALDLRFSVRNLTLLSLHEEDGRFRLWDQESSKGSKEWTVESTYSLDEFTQIVEIAEKEFSETRVWFQSSEIGSTVASKAMGDAIKAIIVSLIGIIGYIWFRFHKVAYGIAAVIALVHDVTIVLGAVAISAWISPALRVLLFEDFKISMALCAAFLTVIGYSLNDTIVVFDRIREVKGKSPILTREMINKSINQTLSRTLLTSFTTFLVVGILYVFGGQAIHGFAFAMLVGVLVGTYSSIFIASPALLWLTETQQARDERNKKSATGMRKSESTS